MMKTHIYFLMAGCLFCGVAFAQNNVKGNKEVSEGNKAYDKGDMKSAAALYQKGLTMNPNNEAARINLALAQGKLLEADKSVKNFDVALKNSKNSPTLNATLNYDKGVSLSKAKKYEDAVKSFENALRINPEDQNTRENLQKAINELKQQQQKQNKQNQDKQNQRQKKQDDKQQQQQQEQQKQQQQQQQMSKNQAEQLLKALRDQEKETQKKLDEQKAGASGGTPKNGKDW